MKKTSVITILIFTGLMVCGLLGCGSEDSSPTPPIQDRYLHVSPNGSSTADGTAKAPLYFPNKAMEKALREGYRGVKFAIGNYTLYAGDIELRFYGGIDLIGGCNPQTWEPVPGLYSRIYALQRPIAAAGIRVPTHIQGLEIFGNSPSSYRETSCAVYLNNCGPELVFEQCRFVARPGYSFTGRADDGTTYDNIGNSKAGGIGSCDESLPVPGGYRGGSSCSGGSGGAGGLPGLPGGNGLLPCQGSIEMLARGGEPGQDGQDGQDGEEGTDAPSSVPQWALGELIAGTINPPSYNWNFDSRAKNGGGGSGGGGGGGSPDATGNGGGGGGAGGNRGGPGYDGTNGGHSIGVICDNSNVVFQHCLFISDSGGDGKDGGNGSAGGPGTLGSPGGNGCPGKIGRGGHGGDGGQGGNGGAGAGGNSGVSYALLVLGTIYPTIDNGCEFEFSAAGTPGRGGLHGNGITPGFDGISGEATGLKILNPTETKQ